MNYGVIVICKSKNEVCVIGIVVESKSLAVRAITNNAAIIRIILGMSGINFKKTRIFAFLLG